MPSGTLDAFRDKAIADNSFEARTRILARSKDGPRLSKTSSVEKAPIWRVKHPGVPGSFGIEHLSLPRAEIRGFYAPMPSY